MFKVGLVLFGIVFFSGCVSCYEGYENDYYASAYGSYYNSPLRLRGLTPYDFYMMDSNPSGYFDTQLWSAVGDISRFSITSIARALAD